MTEGEKLLLWQGHGLQPGVARLSVRPYHRDTICFQGVALNTHDSPWSPPAVTVFPNAINFGMSFDLELAAKVANATASELRGVNELTNNATSYGEMAGPVCDVGPMANTAHDPRWGRIAQVYAEDPFLAGAMTHAVVTGLQQKTRGAPGGDPGGLPSVKSAVTVGLFLGYHSDKSGQVPRGHDAFSLSPRDLHDQYLPAYRRALQGPDQALGVMCSHASMNGVPSCANELLLNKTLRHDWGSSAVVRTDCCGDMQGIVAHGYVDTVQDAVVSAVSAGLQYCFGCGNTDDTNASVDGFAAAIHSGELPPTSLDQAVAAGLLHRFQLGEFDAAPERGPFGSGFAGTVASAEHHALARELVGASAVVLENDGILPLRPATLRGGSNRAGDEPSTATGTVAVIGPFGDCTVVPSYSDRPWVSPNCYCHNYAGVPSKIVTVAGGLAAALPGGFNITRTNGSSLPVAERLAREADVVVLALGLGRAELEGVDRYNLTLPADQQTLLDGVAAAAKKVVLLLFAAGPVDYNPGMRRWPANAVLVAGYPGEEAGSGLADVILGRVNPSGRLPLSWVTNEYLDHVGDLTHYDTADGAGRTYRYIRNSTRFVNYWFGHGLSYTSFAYANVTATPMPKQGVVRVSFRLNNVGGMDGAEVVQIYVTAPPQQYGRWFPTPARSLCGIAKVMVPKGAGVSRVVDVDVACMATVLPDGTTSLSHDGEYRFSVGGNQPGDPRGNPTTTVTVKASELRPSTL